MQDQLKLRDRLSRAYWCGCFSCTERDLIDAVRATGSTDIGTIGLFLATRQALESFEVADAA